MKVKSRSDRPDNRHQNRKKICLVCAVALLFAASAAAAILLSLHSRAGDTALVYQDGEMIKKIDLSSVSQDYTFDVKTADGGYNTIRVTKGAIGVIDANCPDKICEKMGMVSKTNHPISCLPHKLVIQIQKTGNDTSDDIDAVIQ